VKREENKAKKWKGYRLHRRSHRKHGSSRTTSSPWTLRPPSPPPPQPPPTPTTPYSTTTRPARTSSSATSPGPMTLTTSSASRSPHSRYSRWSSTRAPAAPSRSWASCRARPTPTPSSWWTPSLSPSKARKRASMLRPMRTSTWSIIPRPTNRFLRLNPSINPNSNLFWSNFFFCRLGGWRMLWDGITLTLGMDAGCRGSMFRRRCWISSSRSRFWRLWLIPPGLFRRGRLRLGLSGLILKGISLRMSLFLSIKLFLSIRLRTLVSTVNRSLFLLCCLPIFIYNIFIFFLVFVQFHSRAFAVLCLGYHLL